MRARDALMLLAAIVYALYGSAGICRPPDGNPLTCRRVRAGRDVSRIPRDRQCCGQVNGATLPLILYAGALASVMLPFLRIRGVAQLGANRCAIFLRASLFAAAERPRPMRERGSAISPF
ncbi:hypothetical protein [Bradyrhizobium sp. USDA 4454]